MLHFPSRTVRLRLTLLYSGLFLVSGAVLLAITYVLVRSTTGPDLIVAGRGRHGATGPHALQKALANPAVGRYVRQEAHQEFARALSLHTNDLHQLLIWSGIALAIVTLVSIAFGWLVAGRVLRPLRAITATTRQISERNLHERLALSGPHDELKDLADTIDSLLARVQAHVAEQQRFAANASHELRTPLSITQTLLDVARNDPSRDTGELVDRLHAVNARAIDLTEALLLLSRAGQHSFSRDSIDLSLIAEEAIETLLPLAEQRGTTIEVSGEVARVVGSHPLLLQMATNLVHNAIVHNLLQHGSVWVTTSFHQGSAVLTVESTGEQLLPELVARLDEPFQRGVERIRTEDRVGVGLGLAIVKTIVQAHGGTLSLTPRVAGGLHVSVRVPTEPSHTAG
ncbi:MAG TPA: HAMP domain-containing sensor histidine kinase [Solirubrobacteraceae bacterium]|jgi:two-component system sensor histidine kinase VanS